MADPSEALGVISITADRDDSLLYVDGRFMGTLGLDQALDLQLHPGGHDFRLSVQGRPDLFGRLTVIAGKRQVFRATFGNREDSLSPPTAAQPIDVGQTLRLALRPGDSEPSPTWPFRIAGKKGTPVLLVIAERLDPVEIKVTFAKDESDLLLTALEGTDGLDGKEFLVFTPSEDGDCLISIRSLGRRRVNSLVLRVCKAPPPLLTNSKYVGRRAPPRAAER